MSRQNSRDVGGLEVTLNGHQIEIDPIGNGTKTIDDVKVLLLRGPTGGVIDQKQSDWNQTNTAAVDYIKNKPTIPAAQIQSDWNQTNTSAVDYIKHKPDLTKIQSDWDETRPAQASYIKNKPTGYIDVIAESPSSSQDEDFIFDNNIYRLKFLSKIVTIPVTGWDSTPDSNGYYHNIVYFPFYLKAEYQPIISPIGSDEDTPATAQQKADFNLCERFNFPSYVDVENVEVYAKTKPTASFNVMISGIYFDYVST